MDSGNQINSNNNTAANRLFLQGLISQQWVHGNQINSIRGTTANRLFLQGMISNNGFRQPDQFHQRHNSQQGNPARPDLQQWVHGNQINSNNSTAANRLFLQGLISQQWVHGNQINSIRGTTANRTFLQGMISNNGFMVTRSIPSEAQQPTGKPCKA